MGEGCRPGGTCRHRPGKSRQGPRPTALVSLACWEAMCSAYELEWVECVVLVSRVEVCRVVSSECKL